MNPPHDEETNRKLSRAEEDLDAMERKIEGLLAALGGSGSDPPAQSGTRGEGESR